ncbi:neuropeptide CCHamide-1 receptor-like [Acanthaster planci]|uniref:Neuropeptide CCHamide-1 receptor-like n=1 Tax=Acanthaster planci TaxID=133434 RepID=A0A8B7YJQ4_ACAPL|nr:neuropeptide CCHamide-1 receptor-like [Acanthaster planci]
MDVNDTDSDRWDNPKAFEIPPWRWNVSVSICMAVFGVLGNSALLLVILLNRHLRTTSNILVCNLAVADLMMFVVNVPMSTVSWLFISWPTGAFGSFLCKAGGGAWVLSQALCATSLTAVSIERYFSLHRRVQMKRTLAILLVVWTIGLLFTIPVLVVGHTYYIPYFDVHICRQLPDHWLAIRGYITAYALLTYFLPVLVITSCYAAMARVLCCGGVSGESVASVRARHRLAIVVLLLAIVFAVFWFPYHFFYMFFLYSDYDTMEHVYKNFELYMRLIEIAHVLIYVNSCLNPFVVFVLSGVHRQPLLDSFRGRFYRRNRKAAAGQPRRYAPVPEGVYAETTLSVQ